MILHPGSAATRCPGLLGLARPAPGCDPSLCTAPLVPLLRQAAAYEAVASQGLNKARSSCSPAQRASSSRGRACDPLHPATLCTLRPSAPCDPLHPATLRTLRPPAPRRARTWSGWKARGRLRPCTRRRRASAMLRWQRRRRRRARRRRRRARRWTRCAWRRRWRRGGARLPTRRRRWRRHVGARRQESSLATPRLKRGPAPKPHPIAHPHLFSLTTLAPTLTLTQALAPPPLHFHPQRHP